MNRHMPSCSCLQHGAVADSNTLKGTIVANNTDLQKVRKLTKDLRKSHPRSPRDNQDGAMQEKHG